MKHFRIVLILTTIVGVCACILFFPPSFLTTTHLDAQLPPLMIINNMDGNRAHSVQVSVVNSTGTNIFNRTYRLDPKGSITPDILAPNLNEDYMFRIAVDQKNASEALLNMSPTHVVVLELYPDYAPLEISFSIIDVTPSRHRE